MAAVAVQNIPNFHPAVGSFISQQTLQVQNIPGFVPQVQQQSSVMPGLPISATLDTTLPSVIDANFIATQVSQCSSVANISSASTLTDSVVKSVNTVKKQLTYSQQPVLSSTIADPLHHTSSQSISDSTSQPQSSIIFSRASQQNYQLPNLAQQQSMMDNFQPSNLLTENLSFLSQSPQTKSLGVSITAQYHPQPNIPQHESQKASASGSTGPISGSGVTASDVSNVSFRQDMPSNSNCNQASSDCGTASELNANANTNLIQPITLKIPCASFLQNTNAQVLTCCQFSKVDPLPLQQSAPVILLQQPSPTGFVINGDAPSVPENYTQNTSSMLHYHLQQHAVSDFVPASSESYAVSPVMTPVPTPNPASTPIPGAPNCPFLNLHSQIPTEDVHCISKISPGLQNTEPICKLNRVQNFQAEYGQFQGIVYSSKVDQTLDYETSQSCLNVTGSQIYHSDATNINHISDQLLNIQINELPLHEQQFDAQRKAQQVLYSASAETESVKKVSEIHHLVQEAIYKTGEMIEEGLHTADLCVSSKLDKETHVNYEMSSVKTSDTVNFCSKQIHIKQETQRALENLKKDQEESGTQTTPSLDCGSAVVDSPASREIGSHSLVLNPVLGETAQPVQALEAVQIMQSLPVRTSVSDEMAAQGHMQDRRNSSAMSSVQGSPTRSTTKVEDGFFLSRSHN